MRDVVNDSATYFWRWQRRFRYYNYGVAVTDWYPWTDAAGYSKEQIHRQRGRGDLRHGDHKTPNFYEGYKLDLTPGELDYTFPSNPDPNRSFHKHYQWRAIGSWAHHNNSLHYTSQSIAGVPILFPSQVVTDSENLLLSRLADRQMELAQYFAEIRQNAALMTRTALSIVYAYRAVRHGNYALAAKHLGITKHVPSTIDNAADAWLAYKYGWRPLLLDLVSLRDQILSSLEDERATMSVIAAVSDNRSTLPSSDSSFTREGRTEYVCEHKVFYRVSDAALQNLAQLGVTNPLSVAWDLVSYSFVVDWFTGIGNFLSNLSADLGTEFLYGYKIELTRSDLRIRPSDSWFPVESSCRVETEAHTRHVLAGFPHPSPRLNLGLDTNQVLAGLALLNQRL